VSAGLQRRPRKRLAVIRFWYEGNAFSPLPADAAAFQRREWTTGNDALAGAAGTSTELAAVAEFARTHDDWEVVVLRCASALPAGPIDDPVYERLLDDVTRGLSREPFDAVYLSLHGAAITRTRASPDLDLLRRVRATAASVPIGASFDLHGNLPRELGDLIDVASVYRTHPHVDMAETASRVLAQLERCVDGGLATHRALRNDRVLLPSFNMRTDAGPMRALEEAAREATHGAILEVAVFGGFPYADTIHTGASVLVVSDASLDHDGNAARRTADRLAEEIVRLAPDFEVALPSPERAISIALATPGFVAVTDPADNPLSGGGCDTPSLFRALLDARVNVNCVFASFADTRVVTMAREAGVGQQIDVRLGGRYGPGFGEPVAVRAVVERLTDGVFCNVGPMEHGVTARAGPTALLRIVGLRSTRVIVTSEVVAADDPAFYALHGIALDDLRLLCAKAKNHFRAAFASRCSVIVDCDAPGPAAVDLSRLPFRNARVARRPA
jgi:microcystin degradation protein MlrC